MTERYARPTVAGWLLPGIVGSFSGVYVAITAQALLWGDIGPIWRGVGWALAMVLGTIWALFYVAILLGADLALLITKLRTLPVGPRAWLVAVANPLVISFIYRIVPPYKFYPSGPWGVILALLIPAVVVAIASRVLFERKPPR